ncbi:MAG: TonB-dependent receptor [Pseudomonadota bacterium]
MQIRLAVTALPWALLCTAVPAVWAQADVTSLEEIVVTAEWRQPSLQDASSSISVLTLDAPDAAATKHLEELLGQLANVNFSSGASRARFIQIRGIGERGQFAEPLNPSVGLLLDGVDMSGIGTAATLFDVEQVEVFRGPQGTLYGANALAGLINVRSPAPTDELTARLLLDGGNFDARGVGGIVSGPLSENLGLRVAFQSYRDDGFIDNEFLGRDDTTGRDEETLRTKLRWQPSDDTELTLTLGNIAINNGYDNFSLDNTRVTRSDEPGADNQDTTYGNLAWTTALAPGHELRASLAHADSEIDYGYDEDWTFVGFHPFEYSSTDRYQRDRTTTTADVRLLSAPDQPVGWVVGLFGLQQDVSLRRDYTFLSGPFFSEFDIDRLAVYGETTFPVSSSARLRLGARAERHESRYRDTDGTTFSPSDDLFGGRLVFEQDLASGALLYGSLTRGYKAGGFNTDGSLPVDLRQFDPELLVSLEAGFKHRFLDNRLQLRAAAFYMKRDDVQINTSIVRERPDGSSEFIDFTGNGAEGTNLGAELELDFALTESLTLYADLGLLDTEFEDYVNGAGENLSGREQAQAPGYQFHAGVAYQSETGWFSRLAVEGRDEFFFSDSHALRSQAYEVVNASLGYQSGRWSVTLWGRNLGDEDIPVRGFFFGNDPRDGYTARGFTQLGEPRRFGVSLTLDW